MPTTARSKTGLPDRVVGELTTCRTEGGGRYPARLADLAVRLGAPLDPDVLKAASGKAFTARAVSAVKGRGDSPAALLEDLGLLAASSGTLEAALLALAEKGAPPWSAAQVAKAVQPPLRAAFAAAIAGQIEADTLPPFVARAGTGKALRLHHRDHPPPPPPEVQDAERLLDLLRRAPGVLLRADLEQRAGLAPAAFKKAVGHRTFTDAVTQVTIKSGETYLLSSGDGFERFVYGTLLPRLLQGCLTARAHAFPTNELTVLLKDKDQQKAVAALLDRPDLADELPPGVGCVLASRGKGKAGNVFFALDHVRTARPATRSVEGGPVPAPPPADFAAAFDAAFARLDRERGSNNFVSLVDLRPALSGVPREAFDAGLQQLRRERKYALTSDERYDGLTPEQQAAAVREEGEFLLHVSRGRS